MIKPEWGTKRTCPKCAVRFYDLGNEDPVTCHVCGAQWEPDTVLKSKQPLPFDAPKKEVVKVEPEEGEIADDLDIDEDEEDPVDDDNDLGGDDDLGVATRDEDEDH